MSTKTQATVEDLYRIPDNGKAEVVNGEIVLMSPTGDMPGRAGGAIYVSLRGVERRAGGREAGANGRRVHGSGWNQPMVRFEA